MYTCDARPPPCVCDHVSTAVEAVPQGLALHGAPIRQGRATDSVAVCWKTPGKPRNAEDVWSLVAEEAELCTSAPHHPSQKNCRRRLRQTQEDRRSLWTETAAAAAPWFQAPLGILAAGRHIMTVGHQRHAAQWKRGGTVPESSADWWRGDGGRGEESGEGERRYI